MPGFNQQQLAYRARSANQVTVLIGDLPIAFAQTVAHTFEFGTEGYYGIGSAKPQEIQQLKVAPSITIDEFDLTQDGLNLIQPGVTSPISSLLANNKFNIAIIDGPTGQALYTYIGCVAQNFSQSIPANQPVTDALSFLAMDCLDSTGTSILNGPNALAISP